MLPGLGELKPLSDAVPFVFPRAAHLSPQLSLQAKYHTSLRYLFVSFPPTPDAAAPTLSQNTPALDKKPEARLSFRIRCFLGNGR